jgi:predicted GIY-YIG superfamily endonuclease
MYEHILRVMFFCYIICNKNDRTYNGYTVNLDRRLRQHNGFLKGGAKATHSKGPWAYMLILTSVHWDCISIAMKHEWTIRYPTRRRPRPKEFNGVKGRLLSFEKIFEHMEKLKCENIDCYIRNDCMDHMINLVKRFPFIECKPMNEIM